MSGVKIVNGASELHSLMESDRAIIKYGATWCGPCKSIKPVYDRLSTEYSGIVFAEADIDDLADDPEVKSIRSVPTFRYYKRGKSVDQLLGANEQKLRDFLSKCK